MNQARNVAVVNEESSLATQARARVNRFLLSQVGSQFCAGEPELDMAGGVWQVPVLFVTPGFVAGQAGGAVLNWQTYEIISHTSPESIYAQAGTLRKTHHADIETAFLRTRKG
jgi:hypothetical protein